MLPQVWLGMQNEFDLYQAQKTCKDQIQAITPVVSFR
jgi:plasmid maintenance system antidote protein VapI